MKHIHIHCDLPTADAYRTVLRQLCPDYVRDITVHSRFSTLTHEQIDALVDIQKDFSQDRPLRFRNYAVVSRLPRLTKALRKSLRRNGIVLELQVTKEQAPKLRRLARQLEKAGIGYKLCLNETRDQPGVYRLFARQGLSVCFDRPVYTAQTIEQFDTWLYDPAAQGVNTFCDIINMLLLQTHSPNCRYASCFGSTFFVDRQLDIYLCPYHPGPDTKLGALSSQTDLQTLLSADAVAKLLPATVRKRQHCQESCGSFPFCQGGCPLPSGNDPDCGHYGAAVEHIRKRLLEVYRENKVCQVNYIVKNAILNALAFGTAFFNPQR